MLTRLPGKVMPAFIVGAALISCSGHDAIAFEPGAHPTFFIGASDGLPAGALPSDGLYLQNMQFYWDGDNKSKGAVQGRNTVFIGETPVATWVPGWTLLGGRYSTQMLVAVTAVTVTSQQAPVGTHSSTGVAAFDVLPLRLTWDLPEHFHVTSAFGFGPPVGKYAVRNAINNADNFWGYQVTTAATYSDNGLNLTLSPHVSWSSQNTNSANSPTKDYQSGSLFWFEYTATQDFGKWTAGITGEYAKQIDDDSAAGINLPGTKLERLNAGPYVGYDFGNVTLGAMWTRTVMYNNTFGGDYIWFRLGWKIF